MLSTVAAHSPHLDNILVEEHPGDEAPPCRAGFILFLLVTITLFVRPSEIFPWLVAPVYLILIILAAAASIPAIVHQLRWSSLVRKPSVLCVLGLIPAIMLAHLSHFNFEDARLDAFEFSKTVLYFLLLVSLIRTEERFRLFLIFVCVLTAVTAIIALLQWHEIINIPSLTEITEQFGDDEDVEEVVRLCALGIFSDPNDLAVILSVSMMVALFFMLEPRTFFVRLALLGLIGVCGYAFSLTQSRGGLIALLAGLSTFLLYRFSRRKATILAVLFLPALLIAVGGRQTSINLDNSEDTGQGRVQLWIEALELFKEAPLFGVGQGVMADEVGHVAHNSYVQSFCDLGLFGGTLFVCSIGIPIVLIGRRSFGQAISGHSLSRLRPCLMAVLVAFAAGIHSITRTYTISTYVIFGLGAAYLTLVAKEFPALVPRFDQRLCLRIAGGGVGFLAYIWVFVHIFGR